MRRKLVLIKKELKQKINQTIQITFTEIYHWFLDIWFKSALVLAFLMLLSKKDVNFQLDANGFQIASFSALKTHGEDLDLSILPNFKPVAFNSENDLPKAVFAKKNEQSITPNFQKTSWKDNQNLGNTYSNMTYTVGDFATKQSTSQFKTKRAKQLGYIKRFAHVAESEMSKFGIPASITLAQGLLESNVGESRLSVKNNNHFGMKCFSKSCKKGHCSNFTDDSHKDFFRKYQTAWESYRAHSLMLRGKRYRHLLKLPKTDYKGWAKGLKKAGYATDKRYAEKLINLIENLKLYEYDK